ncbi:MAG: hypothetical protein ACTSW7_00500 [Candidatus Thorarchaeota archaeon]|nr:hypothetical protein [Thermoplasmatales archaeon]
MFDMQHEVQSATFLAETKDHKTLRNAMMSGINVGMFGFTIVENNEDVFYNWRLRGDIIEIREPESSNDNDWEAFDDINYDVNFNIGVYGKQVDWSIPNRFLKFINL